MNKEPYSTATPSTDSAILAQRYHSLVILHPEHRNNGGGMLQTSDLRWRLLIVPDPQSKISTCEGINNLQSRKILPTLTNQRELSPIMVENNLLHTYVATVMNLKPSLYATVCSRPVCTGCWSL